MSVSDPLHLLATTGKQPIQNFSGRITLIESINKLSYYKYEDFDGFSNFVIKKAAHFLIKHLHFIFNLIIKQSTFPECPKVSVINLFKNEKNNST